MEPNNTNAHPDGVRGQVFRSDIPLNAAAGDTNPNNEREPQIADETIADAPARKAEFETDDPSVLHAPQASTTEDSGGIQTRQVIAKEEFSQEPPDSLVVDELAVTSGEFNFNMMISGRNNGAMAKIPFLVDTKNLPGSGTRLMQSIGKLNHVYVRGGLPVMLVREKRTNRMRMVELTVNSLVVLAHEHFQPFVRKLRGGRCETEDVTLPERVARLGLAPSVVAELKPLVGITSTPLLGYDGELCAADGYDSVSAMFFDNVPAVVVPKHASRQLAEAALQRLRQRIRTFPFADAQRIAIADFSELVVDPDVTMGAEESTFLIAAATAIFRQSLRLVPGVAIIAPYVSGAGVGKGLLARFIGELAHGEAPRAVPPGHNAEELDKRVSAELMTGSPMVFLDNVNDTDLRSNVMASAITENPARVRRLGYSEMVELNHFSFFCVTGNGLTLTEDLRRRFLQVRLEPGQERPESRNFAGDFLRDVKRDRAELLSDFFTIIRWAQQNPEEIPYGKPLGSFNEWARLCRDPFVALGCKDPVEAMEQRSYLDPLRQEICEIFELWWRYHGESLVECSELHSAVRSLLNPYGRPRQYVQRRLARLDGTINNGLKFEALAKTGKWSPIKYKLTIIGPLIDEDRPVGGGNNNGAEGESVLNPIPQPAKGPVRLKRAIGETTATTGMQTQPSDNELANQEELKET